MLFEYGIQNNYAFDTLFPKQADRYRGTGILWSIYVLDHRWSLLNSLPSALSEDDLDHFRPVSSSKSKFETITNTDNHRIIHTSTGSLNSPRSVGRFSQSLFPSSIGFSYAR
jgi:hypothetical protein